MAKNIEIQVELVNEDGLRLPVILRFCQLKKSLKLTKHSDWKFRALLALELAVREL